MEFGTVALLLMAAWFAVLWLRARVRRARTEQLPPGVAAMGTHLRPYSTSHYDACAQALRAFASEYRLTFQAGRCDKKALMSLHGLREDALRHMYQMRMRLPNDLGAERDLTRHIEDTDRLLSYYIEDTQKRGNLSLLLPGPIDDMFYKQHYRAHNDTLS